MAADVPVVKIGLVAPFEGSFREVGYDAIYAARLAVREINRHGGVAGWRFELAAYDDRGEPDLAVQVARNLVADPTVIAVIGHFRPETTSAAADIYAAAGLPFITMGGWGEAAPTTWHLLPSPSALAEAMRQVSPIPAESSPVVWGRAPASPALSRDGALQPPAAPEGEDVIALDAPLVQSYLPPIAAGETLSRWRRAGWSGHLVGDWALSASAFGKLAGPAAMGAVFVTPYPYPADVSDTAQWMEDYQTMGPHVPAPGPYALPTYEAHYIIAEALAADLAGAARHGAARQDVTRKGLALALGEIARTGWLGRITWDDQHCWHAAPLYAYRWGPRGPEFLDIGESGG